MAMYSWLYLIPFLGCSLNSEPTQEENLVHASEKVIFASIEKLGSHRSMSTFQRKEYHGEDQRSAHEEILEITWNDWDNFREHRRVNTETVYDVIVSDSQTWDYVGEKWISRPDGELYRVQLRSTWNQWENTMRHFNDHVRWEMEAREVVEGRETLKYVAVFDRPEDTKTALRPLSFKGTVWVDDMTAVRILGEISGALGRGPYKKEIHLQVQRSGIGERPEISPPVSD